MSFRTYAGYTHSENGWPMVNRDGCVIVDGPAPFVATAPIRAGAAAVILGDFARRYHAECAPIVSSVWGWSPTNSVPNSNHLSGTALDINAPQWPFGYLRMPPDLVERIEQLLACYDGAVFWGREWTARPDEMHFQIGFAEGDPRLDVVVDRIIRPTAVPVHDPRTDPTVRAGFFQLIPPNRWPR
ncbi:M15 family metallopeptidase [Nocardia takedensis]|uniref:M15 family metallopeptidase n=1 Tax=Nocardia takedensis TaxID=259390 RepID=UPI003F763C28